MSAKDIVLKAYPRAISIHWGKGWQIWRDGSFDARGRWIERPVVLGLGNSAVRAWEDAATCHALPKLAHRR